MIKRILEKVQQTQLDVSDNAEFESRNLPEFINIPIIEIALNLSEIRKLPQPIIVYSTNGKRSRKACQLLQAAGLLQVIDGGRLSSNTSNLAIVNG